MSRYLTFFALLALTAAYPASENLPNPVTITETDFEDSSPWFRFPPFGNIFAPLTKLFSSFAGIGPKIEVNDKEFRVIINVKDYNKDDLKVKVKGDFILVQGTHEAKHEDHDLYATQFFHTYTLPVNASASDVHAVLTSDGYLEVVAPTNGADESSNIVDKEVTIVESGKPLKDEKDTDVKVDASESVDKVDNKTENVDKIEEPIVPKATPEPELEEKKEPTTPGIPEDALTTASVEQNKVPQDNEVSNANEIQP